MINILKIVEDNETPSDEYETFVDPKDYQEDDTTTTNQTTVVSQGIANNDGEEDEEDDYALF